MTIGFIGLGNIGLPMAQRLIRAGHDLTVFDTRREPVQALVVQGATAASCARDVADRAETVLASLPSPQASVDVATGADGAIEGGRIQRFIDLSTVGASTAQRTAALLAERGIAYIDCPVSGGVGGARQGTLSLMVSGPPDQVDTVRPVLDALGRVFVIGEQTGAAQTMKLVNNLLAATTLAATAEAVVLGVKAGLDPAVMIDVLNASSGGTHASRDKFPRAVLPRTFDYGFATGLMVKDVRLCLDQIAELGLSLDIAQAVGQVWGSTLEATGAESDFTTVIKPMEDSAGLTVGGHSA